MDRVLPSTELLLLLLLSPLCALMLDLRFDRLTLLLILSSAYLPTFLTTCDNRALLYCPFLL